jgi:hypothetical protein
MELTLVDASNPIHEWMERARSTVHPELDEESPDTNAPTLSAMVTAAVDPRDLQRRTGSSSVSEWARRNIGDSHRGKRKTYAMQLKKQSKRLKGKKSHLMELQKMKIAQPMKSLMTVAPELTVMMVTTEMTLVVVLPHWLQQEAMNNLSLPSRLTNSHTAPRIETTAPQHHQEFPHVRQMLRLIVLAPLLMGLMMSLSLAHIHITSQTFRVSRLPGGFMSGLIQCFITCVIRTGEALQNGHASHNRNIRPTFFETKVLCSYRRISIMQYRMRSQYSGR